MRGIRKGEGNEGREEGRKSRREGERDEEEREGKGKGVRHLVIGCSKRRRCDIP